MLEYRKFIGQVLEEHGDSRSEWPEEVAKKEALNRANVDTCRQGLGLSDAEEERLIKKWEAAS